MLSLLPVKLSGNLGDRHHCINNLVHQAYFIPKFKFVHDLPEESTADRLFKIDLASKHRDVEYIIHTLKDDDMLYVSRALKSSWLLDRDHCNIINPRFLENELYPQMRLQAVNKMRNWTQLHLRSPEGCEDFYKFYKERDFDRAAKFLCHCSNAYVLNEIVNVLDKMTPKLLKRLSENVPEVSKIFFNSLKHNQTLVELYYEDDRKFFATVKYLLKTDADTFFDIVEKFFFCDKFPSFSSEITKYIMKNHKNMFMNKPELYTAYFLNMKALAKCLNPEEIKDLIVKLARAAYLQCWFSYQRVEPLIKSLSIEERTAIKKQIFVDKAFGPTVKEWPYAIPKIPELKSNQNSLFLDKEFDPWFNRRHVLYDCAPLGASQCALKYEVLKKRKKCYRKCKTLLDQLFDQYRFTSFKRTLLELRKRLRAESSPQNRQHMLLVLVSKTGGRMEHLAFFLDHLIQFKNEPAHIRAAIVRSLVKRAFVWRLTPEYWAKLFEWAHGLGLDGSSPEAACSEGLHAVIIRDILANVIPARAVWKAFLNEFSNLNEYTLTADERRTLRTRLPALLLAEAESYPEKAPERVSQLLDTLSAYRISIGKYPGIVDAIGTIAKRNFDSAEPLLHRLYTARVARKALFRENFELIQTDASYVNALRHDNSILEETERFEKKVKEGLKYEKFLRKLAIYFAEKDGLAQRYRTVLQLLATNTINDTTEEKKSVRLGRPLALLAGSTFPLLLTYFDSEPRLPAKQKLAVALRANVHVVRPAFDLESFGWRAAGAKAVINCVSTCRQEAVEQYLQPALAWGRTMRLGLMLANRVNKEREAYEIVASKRPAVALKAALKYFQHRGNYSDPQVWKTVQPIIEKYDVKRHQREVNHLISKLNSIPMAFKAEYCVLLYKAHKKTAFEIPRPLLGHLHDVLSDVNPSFILEEIEDFLKSDMIQVSQMAIGSSYYDSTDFYTDVIAKYLLFSTSDEMLKKRLQTAGEPFFKRIEVLWKTPFEKKDVKLFEAIINIIDSFLRSLKQNKVFFDTTYVSCLPIFEKILEHFHSFLPIERWFNIYASIHLNIIYFKTVRYCLKQYPEAFSDESKKIKVGAKMLGVIFGKFVAGEVQELTQKYFMSIIDLYKVEVWEFIYAYLGYSTDESSQNFTKCFIKSLLSEQQASSHLVAEYLFARFQETFVKDSCIEDILRILKETENEEQRMRIEVANIL